MPACGFFHDYLEKVSEIRNLPIHMDAHLLHNPPPVEQMLVFFGGEMDEDAVVGLDALDERVGEFVFL